GGGGGGGGGRGGGGPRGPLFGGGPGGPPSSTSDRRYTVTFGASARNVFNKVNFGNPSGILGSRFFDQPNGLAQGGPFSNGAANRRVELQATFNFCSLYLRLWQRDQALNKFTSAYRSSGCLCTQP